MTEREEDAASCLACHDRNDPIFRDEPVFLASCPVSDGCDESGTELAMMPKREEHYSRIRGDGLPPRAPNSYFFAERAYPFDRIPRDQWRAARAEAEVMKLESGQRSRSPAWIPRGPTNIGGRMTAIAVHPANSNIVYAAAAEGGVLLSTDGGQHWTPLFDDQPSLAVGAIAIDPSQHNVIYAGTGEVNPGGGSMAYGGSGLFRSTDSGTTWTCIGLEETGAIGRIRIDPTDSDRIFVAAMGYLWDTNPERGVYRTTDGGATWERVHYVNDQTGCVDLIMRPDDPDVILAAMWQRIRQPEYYSYGGSNCAVWKTTDGGDTWSKVGGGLPASTTNSGRIGLSLCAAQPDRMYAVYADKTGYFDGLYRSNNGGISWTRTNDGSLSYVFASYGWWFGNVRAHPVNPDILFVLGLYFYRSTNGGSSYHDASGGMHVDHHGLDFGPGSNPVMYNGNDGGVYRSTNGGTGWSKLPDLPVLQIYRLALDANNPVALYCGSQDNGTVRTKTGSHNFDHIYGGDGFQPLVHPNNSNIIWAQSQYGNLGYSTNGGSSFSSAMSGISYSDRFNWNCPLIQDPNIADRRYFGTHRVYRSTGYGSWTAVSPDLTGGPHQGNPGQVNGTLTTLAVSPRDRNAIWAGSDDGYVHVTANGGTTWTDVSAGLPDRWITSVRGDPFDQDTAYVTVSGFRWAEPLPHVYRTTDLGANWEPIAGNLPEVPVNEIAPDPAYPGRYFVATDVGVFETMDGGGTWSILGTGLPNVVVTSLGLNPDTRELVAGTYGRSFFSCSIELEPGTITKYGSGLVGSGGFVPDLDGSGEPLYGNEITIDLTQGLGGTQGVIYAGLDQANLPFMGGTLLVYPIVVVVPIVLAGPAGVPGQGTFSFSFTGDVTNVSVYAQILLADPGAAKGISMSNGLEIVFP
ncbi:MAG: WD40/YVTN/BNR-like repeat-containing protein [Planctomycetota bacterium]